MKAWAVVVDDGIAKGWGEGDTYIEACSAARKACRQLSVAYLACKIKIRRKPRKTSQEFPVKP